MGLRNDIAMSRSCGGAVTIPPGTQDRDAGYWRWPLRGTVGAINRQRHCTHQQRSGLSGLQEWCWDLGGADWGSRKGKILLRGTAYILKSKITSAREILPAKAGVPGKQFCKSF